MARFANIFRHMALLIVAFMFLLSSCGKIKDISITSVGIESISPRGFKGIDAVVLLGISNPAGKFAFSNVDGHLFLNGAEIAVVTADTLSVDKKSVKVYSLPCSLTLTGGLTLLKAIPKLTAGNLEGLTADVSATVKLLSGPPIRLKFKNLDIEKMASDFSGKVKPDETERL